MKFSTVVVYNNFPKIVQRLVRVRDEELKKAAEEIRKIAAESMEGGKSGRVYGSHQASAPGEAPAVWYDNLRAGLQGDLEKPGTAVVWSEEKYAPMLEFGTSRMAPRPYLALAAQKGVGKLVVAMSNLEPKLK